MTRQDFDNQTKDKQRQRSLEARKLIEEAREMLLRGNPPKDGRTDVFVKRLEKWLKTKKTIRTDTRTT